MIISVQISVHNLNCHITTVIQILDIKENPDLHYLPIDINKFMKILQVKENLETITILIVVKILTLFKFLSLYIY